MRCFSFEVPGNDDQPLRGEVHLPDPDRAPTPEPSGKQEGASSGRRPGVIAVHGFKGFRRWGFWPAIAERFTAAGLGFVGFDMSHNGVGRDGLHFDQEELFEKNTFGREQSDLAVILSSVRAQSLPGSEFLDPDRLALLGHSRGGGLVVVTAADDPAIRCTVALAPIASNRRIPADQVAAGLERGFLPIVNTRTGQVLRMGRQALEEIRDRDDLADFTEHAALLSAPLLVVHGTADPAVSVDDGRRLAAAAPDGRFVPIEGADHVLGCRHPWAETNPDFERFLEEATTFVTAHV